MEEELAAILQEPDASALSQRFPCTPALTLVDFGGTGAAAAVYDELLARGYAGRVQYACLLSAGPPGPAGAAGGAEPPSKMPTAAGPSCNAWATACLKAAAGKPAPALACAPGSEPPTYEALCAQFAAQSSSPAAEKALTLAKIAARHMSAPRPLRPSPETDVYLTLCEADFQGLRELLAAHSEAVGRATEPRADGGAGMRQCKVALSLCLDCGVGPRVPCDELPRACARALLNTAAGSARSLNLDALQAELAAPGLGVPLRAEKVQGVFARPAVN